MSTSTDLPAGPLKGLRVLDLGTVYAAPITAMLLGDWGADVIKVEHPRGDPARTHGLSKDGHGLWWKVIARNKRTITLNFSTPEGQDILRRLVAQADVVIENFRPGVLEKWDLGPEELQKINPALVVLRVTGFGQAGPVRQPASVRHARRGDERPGPPDRRGERPADVAAVRAGRRRRRADRRLRGDAGAVPPGRRRRRAARSSTCRCWNRWSASSVPDPASTTSSG